MKRFINGLSVLIIAGNLIHWAFMFSEQGNNTWSFITWMLGVFLVPTGFFIWIVRRP